MAKEKELKDQRIPIMMSETELSAIDDWSFKNRIRSRGEAIRRLCQIGLISDEAKIGAQRDEPFKAEAAAAILGLDHVFDDAVRAVVRAIEEGEISETEKPAVQSRIAEAQRQLDLINAKILGNG
ncbi:hypothetical protein [Rhizobium sp. N4311]|uniref:hypothetical protein n=1 Tax=Rhizobium sp. N4311 TaxID=1703972 RepID=UPI000B96AB04|nr:hypothetical protein [Rhizobium sp. N4311]OYD05777.1 hypothetical protein AMK08_CH103848 [Rhizobium sp. N4311]